MRKPIISERVLRHLLQNLAAGRWPAGGPLPSLRAAAHSLRVSVKPVLRAWQQALAEGLIEKDPRGRARVAADAPRRARVLLADPAVGKRTKRLAILMSHRLAATLSPTRTPFQWKLVDAASRAGSRRGYAAEVIGMLDTDQFGQAQDIAHRYDAAFVIELSPEYLALIGYLREDALPILMFQRKVPGLSVPSLTTDDYSAAQQLVGLLVERGHTNVSFLLSQRHEVIMDRRLSGHRGWMDALRQAGILEQCVMPVVGGSGRDLPLLLDRLLALRPRVTGIVLESPAMLGTMADYPHSAAVRVPRDLSIAATSTVSHIPVPAGYPPITCFEVDWQRAGQCAIEMFDRMIAGTANPKNIRVPLRLVLTDSIGPPPGGAESPRPHAADESDAMA